MTATLPMQVLVILATAQLCAAILRRVGQPSVVGEVVAGILLGPIALGTLAPAVHEMLFPINGLAALDSIGQVGLVLFMFTAGTELRAAGERFTSAAYVALPSVVLPLCLSIAIAPALYPDLAGDGVNFWTFALFFAVATAVTAFPVMARILRDNPAVYAVVGRLALGAAAIVDTLAWTMLAMVVAFAGSRSSVLDVLLAAGGLAFLVGALRAARPLYRILAARGVALGAITLGVFACAAFTEWLHLHAALGALLFGALLPQDQPSVRTVIGHVEHMVVVALLPIFFALSGLRTTPDALVGDNGAIFALVLCVAVAGKLVGGTAGARLARCNWRNSFAIGALMNTRGLMELVVIKIGLDAGIIGPALFTILLIVAVVTTMMTNPLLLWMTRARAEGAESRPPNKGATELGSGE